MAPPSSYRTRVLIAGAGVAGMEAALALRAFAAERVEVELLDSWADLVGRGRRPSYLKVNPLAGKQATVDDPSSAMTGLSA